MINKSERISTDQKTADAFAASWNNLPSGSVYTQEQFNDWLDPLKSEDISGKTVLELGCGNASLMVYLLGWHPEFLVGVDLGDCIETAKKNLSVLNFTNWKIIKDDLTLFKRDGFDVVYCIGVLHHLKNPAAGFNSVIANTKPGGKFHCWVYGREGNGFVVFFVDPLRRLVCRLPWWLIKYFIATPLAVPFYGYANFLSHAPKFYFLRKFPLYDYCLWIASREFSFFCHVVFDQLVTPQTTYLDQATIRDWLGSYPQIDSDSVYLIRRNGNSWKFGGIIKKTGVN